MARNRQQAKQRQAERRAKRLAEQGKDGGDGGGRRRAEAAPLDDPTAVEPSPAVPPELAVGAPPTDEGRSDRVFHSEPTIREPDEPEDEVMSERDALQEIEDWEIGEDEKTGGESFAPRGRRGADETAADRKRPRVVQFLVAVWAELQRVQWPDRQALTTLTGVVLGFVLIAGGYLGLLDAVASKLVNAIL